MKKVLLLLVVAGVIIGTMPLWGSCDLNAQVCNGWCSIRHIDSDINATACKTRCSSDKISCLAEQGAEKVEDIFKELSK